MLISFWRVIKFAWQGFWRNFWLSLATIFIIALTLIIVNFLIIINIITQSAIQSIHDKIDISFYLKNDTAEATIMEMQDFFKTHPQVKEIRYISADEALKNFRNLHKDDRVILESLEELEKNPLSATLIIKAENINDYKELSSIIDNSKYRNNIADKNFKNNELFIEIINNISRKINRAGIIATIIFTIIAILITFNTIRMAIYTHREEIGIMKLVGANNIFITIPFVFESVTYALLGVCISVILIYPVLNFIQPYIADFFKGTEVNLINYFNQNFIIIFGVQLAGIILLNILSSTIAIRRYLRV